MERVAELAFFVVCIIIFERALVISTPAGLQI